MGRTFPAVKEERQKTEIEFIWELFFSVSNYSNLPNFGKFLQITYIYLFNLFFITIYIWEFMFYSVELDVEIK